MILEVKLVHTAFKASEVLCELILVGYQDVLAKPVQMTYVVIYEMLDLGLVRNALEEVYEDTIDLKKN